MLYSKRKKAIKILIIIVFLLLLALVLFFIPPFYLSNEIIDGVYIDDINLSGLNKDAAINILAEYEKDILSETTITVEIKSSSYTTTLRDYDVHLSFDSVLDAALAVGNEDCLICRILKRNKVSKNNLFLTSEVIINEQQLDKILTDYKLAYDSPVVEATIDFDPFNYDYFNETHDSSSMFTITEGRSGWAFNYDDSISLLREALIKNEDINIILPIVEIPAHYTQDELEKCTTLIYHSSCYIPSSQRFNETRNHNMQKVLNLFKGLVVLPGETISYNEVLGERTLENGWLYPPITTRETKLNYSFMGINQAATTVYNAAVMAGAEIIERNIHSWPAYYGDYGYGMDAFVIYGEKDLVFKNNTDYPMFFDAYFLLNSQGLPSYIDVDVYTMPLEDDLHLRIESVIEDKLPPPAAEYIELDDYELSYANWHLEEDLNKMILVVKKPRDEYRIRIYKVWYKDCVETSPGIWEEGIEVRREKFDYAIYPSVQEIIFIKPIPED